MERGQHTRDRMRPGSRLAVILTFLVLWGASTGALGLVVKHVSANGRHTAHALKLAEGAIGKAATQERALRLAQIANCHRGNERTVSDNLSQLDDYRFFSLTAKLIRVAITQPQPNTGLTAKQRAEGIERAQVYVQALEGDAKRKVWHHLIENCAYAIDHPETYVLRPAVQFARTGNHHTPPRGALRIEKGE